MRFALSSGDELTLGNAGMRQPNWLDRYPEPKSWSFQSNHRFVGLQVWQSQSAIHQVSVITLDSDCQQASLAAAAAKGAQDEQVTPIKNDTSNPEEADIKEDTEEKSSLKTEIVILITLVSFAAFLALVTLISILCKNAKAKRNL